MLLLGDIYRRLRKGARDRYTTLYRQYTNVAKMVQVADGVTALVELSGPGVT